jgi:two-component system phosphate regulon sensor histidine kinase PhoR
VGEGETAFGVLWVGYSAAPREWSRAELSLLQHVAGNVGYGLMQGALIGTQQQVLQRLQQLDQAKADFLATVNHELRTPLTSITAYLDMIRDGEAGDVPLGVAQMLEVVHRNAGRLRSMIEDMLTVSRQAEPVPDLQLAPVDVTELLRTVTATLRPSAATRRVRLTVSGPAREAVVRANAPQLEQVFLNIVTNAVKFTPDGGQVRVVAAPDAVPGNAGGVRVEVRDTGIGIPEDELADLFTRFFRASNATATAVPGSGLGLSIAKDIVASHRGSIEVGSVLGQGTAVTVRLPADPAAAAVSDAGQDGTGDRVGPAFIRGADAPPRRP